MAQSYHKIVRGRINWPLSPPHVLAGLGMAAGYPWIEARDRRWRQGATCAFSRTRRK
jgi:hypothetical protein